MTDETRQERPAAGKAGKGASPRISSGASRPGRPTVRSRPDRYLVAALPPADVRAITSQLEDDESCRVIRILSEPGNPGTVVTARDQGRVVRAGPDQVFLPALLIPPDQVTAVFDLARQVRMTGGRARVEQRDPDAVTAVGGR